MNDDGDNIIIITSSYILSVLYRTYKKVTSFTSMRHDVTEL
jgi:hypothetical protein